MCDSYHSDRQIIQALGTTKKVISYFSHSTHNASRLTAMRQEAGVARGLEKVGKTRFATHYWSALSVERNLSSISSLVKDGSATIKVRYVLHFIGSSSC